jgi:hypothetical protein
MEKGAGQAHPSKQHRGAETREPYGPQITHSGHFHGINGTRHQAKYPLILTMVPKGGFEPARVSSPPPQDGVSAKSTTSALIDDSPFAIYF